MGHVPPEPIRAEGAGAELQGRQRGGVAPSRRVAARIARGRWAEDLVARHYEARGWRIVARNWTCRGGELDVVAFRDGVLVVCEVKARASLAFGHPGDAVTPEKVRRVRHAAALFRDSLRGGDPALSRAIRDVRYDVALVVGRELEVLEDAI